MDYREAIDSRGLKHKYIVEKLQISKTLFSLFLSGQRNLRPEKIRTLNEILKK